MYLINNSIFDQLRYSLYHRLQSLSANLHLTVLSCKNTTINADIKKPFMLLIVKISKYPLPTPQKQNPNNNNNKTHTHKTATTTKTTTTTNPSPAKTHTHTTDCKFVWRRKGQMSVNFQGASCFWTEAKKTNLFIDQLSKKDPWFWWHFTCLETNWWPLRSWLWTR